MDYLSQLGSLVLGSRLKRLSERLSQEVATIYNQQHIRFEPRWFPVFHFLGTHGEASIMDIAKSIDVTHPAVNQVASEMLNADVIVQVVDEGDKRRRLLSLSKKGQKLHDELEHVWRVIRVSINEALEQSGDDLLTAIQSLEQTLDKQDLPARFTKNDLVLKNARVEIIDFAPAHRDEFRRLNEAWILQYFAMEPADLEILSAPEQIIEGGGSIFFAQVGDKIVGTCALLKLDDGSFEIAKMAVVEEYQGLGSGRVLLQACIDRAQSSGARVITLETNTRLASAIKLYKKAGFKQFSLDETHPPKFARVNLVMKLDLKSAPVTK